MGMMKGNRTAIVGAFVIGGVLLFALGLFLIGNRRMLFERNFEIHTQFSNISGLQNGALVRVAGMEAGEVTQIEVPGGPARQFRVRLRIRENLRPIIRTDSVASIQNDGLVGNRYVQVQAGSEHAPQIEDDGTIPSEEPFDFADALRKLNETIEVVTEIVEDVKVNVERALEAVTETAQDAQALMADVGVEVRAITTSTQRVTEDLTVITSGLREGRGTVGKLLTDDSLFVRTQQIADEAEKAMANLREAADQAREAVADFRGEDGPIKGVTGDLQQTITHARTAMHNLAENTEALKRNFFFRGFFNRRGYFNLQDVTVQEYRAGALENGDRVPLRIWAAAGVLFERDGEGRETLTDDGRARLDSAMAAFVKYPRTTPFVVEGYAEEPTGADRFLLSRSRAELVRDYLVERYGLDPNYVTTMPMGAEAVDSPAGARWDGVALAMFVSRAVL
jgi:phospholipid/cholesterol/gamma-HCH transport system substrate-binding protein